MQLFLAEIGWRESLLLVAVASVFLGLKLRRRAWGR
jgi:hypothetical protein